MTNVAILKHSFSNALPDSSEINVGEIALQIYNTKATLYTKDFNGNIIEIGKGVEYFHELLDIDLTNAVNGSFLVKEGNKFIASNYLGSLTNLVDVEINNPTNAQYVRWDSLFNAFRNFNPSYGLWELTNVNLPDPTNTNSWLSMNNNVLSYDHNQGKFITRSRINLIANLSDVNLVPDETKNQLFVLDSDLKWKNKDLEIVWDKSPELGGNLDAKNFAILNSSYRTQTVLANTPTINLNYALGDYFIINGVASNINAQCILNPIFNTPLGSTSIMMLELRQSTGVLLIGGLINVRYEDGRPIQLSGDNKIDLITITNVKDNAGVETNYITAAALNMARLGEGGNPAYRYDKDRYPSTQLFTNPNLYDDYWKYVVLLLNFEPRLSDNKLWYEDKSLLNNPVTTTALNKSIPIYTFGLQESVAEFDNNSKEIIISPTSSINLPGDFTVEFYLNYPLDSDYINLSELTHTYFTNSDGTFSIRYIGAYNSTQNTVFQIRIGNNIYTYKNAYNYFQYRNNRYIHISLTRKNTQLYFAVDGIIQNTSDSTINNPITNILIDNPSRINLKGLFNSLRITKGIARYITNYTIPAMRYGFVGGAENILQAQVFDTYMQLNSPYYYSVFC